MATHKEVRSYEVELKVWMNIVWDLLCEKYPDIPRKEKPYDEPAELYAPLADAAIVEIDGRRMLKLSYANGPLMIRWRETLESSSEDDDAT